MKRTSPARWMTRAAALAVLGSLFVLAAGCTGDADDAAPREEQTERSGASTERTAPSDAARSRGLPVDSKDEEAEEVRPEVTLDSMTYEWRESPDRGLHVRLEFVNPNVTYERARGYAFLIASSSLGGDTGVYPWNAGLSDGEPKDHRDGTHLLYRDDQTVSAFIPYRGGVGYYDRLKMLVYDEDGELLIGQSYELELDGSPSGPKEMEPALVL